MMTDPYAVLGVSRGASKDDIKKAYRQKAKLYHPDLHPNDPVCAQKFKEINEAYQLISSGRADSTQNTYGNAYGQNPYGQSGNPYGQYGYGQQGGNGQYQWGPFGFGRYYTYGQNQNSDDDSDRGNSGLGRRLGGIIFAIVMFNVCIFLLRACMYRMLWF